MRLQREACNRRLDMPSRPTHPPSHPPAPQSLSKGCKLWGAVIEVTPRELVVSLPHGLRGHVAYAEASDWLGEQSKKAEKAAAAAAAEEDADGGAAAAGRKRKAAAGAGGGAALPQLSDLFHIGQLVRCTVAGLRTGAEAGEEAAGKGGKGGKGSKSGSARKRVDLSLRVSKMNAGLGERSETHCCCCRRRQLAAACCRQSCCPACCTG